MVFNEATKLEAKRLSHYKCCLCSSFGFLEVHHITPQEDEGPDTLDNAAPLCPTCHDNYGGNKEKRKWMREKRDFWMAYCKEKLYNEDINQLEKLQISIEKMKSDNDARIKNMETEVITMQQSLTVLSSENQRLITTLKDVSFEKRPEVLAQIGSTATAISGSVHAMTQLGPGVYANPRCASCGAQMGLYISNMSGPPYCPACKSRMY